MMKRTSLWFSAIFFAILIGTLPATLIAQTSHAIASESTVVVDGTSNKSDWSVKAEQIDGMIELTDGAPTSAWIEIPVVELKSGRSLIMDRLMRGAFKTDEHPSIRFEMTEATEASAGVIDVTGNLTMAGVTNEVTIQFNQKTDDAGAVTFEGKTDLNMKDYEMDPPSAMFGSLLTKPEVVINFLIKLAS